MSENGDSQLADGAYLFKSAVNARRLMDAYEHILLGSYHTEPEADEALGETGSSVRLAWVVESWQDYCHWRDTDPEKHEHLIELLRRVVADPAGEDDTVAVHKYGTSRAWSHKLFDGHRLLYMIEENADHAEDANAPVDLVVLQARYHQ